MGTGVGEPRGNCSERGSGVFARGWMVGMVELDCDRRKGTIPGETGFSIARASEGRNEASPS